MDLQEYSELLHAANPRERLFLFKDIQESKSKKYLFTFCISPYLIRTGKIDEAIKILKTKEEMAAPHYYSMTED